ncbi:MAG: TonB-dependent receptor, partial [Anaerolineae bacterium]|nr:TonB-dependent receptor [Anaerolineae bacterium]
RSVAALACLLLGFAAGAESDLAAYLAGRYFGMAHYGKIYGMLYMPFGICSAISPLLYAYVRDTAGSYDLILTPAIGMYLLGGGLLLLLGKYPQVFELTTDAAAVFGQLSYKLTEKLQLTGGLRYTWEQKDMQATLSPDYWYPIIFGPQNLGPTDQDESWTNLSWKLVAHYHVTDDTMVYLSVTNGFKSGGWSSDALQPVDEETVLTCELGYKAMYFDNSVRLNLAAFLTDYKDLQLNGTPAGGGFTRVNAGEVESHGLEAELSWVPIQSLEIAAYVSTFDGEYDQVDGRAIGLINEHLGLKQAPEAVYGAVVSLTATISWYR